jgi:predicted dehydrogenase
MNRGADADLKVGIVGFGGAGMAQHLHFSSIPGSRVVSIFDPKPNGRARAKSYAPSVVLAQSFSELLTSGINVVAVCSPDRTHADYVVGALEAGKHVICEKPLADSLEGCRRILQAEAAAKGVVAAVQHQMRFLPVHREMKRLIKSGNMGRISYIEGYYVHNLTQRAFLYDDWRRTDNATPLVYSGCHFVDLLRWLLDDEVEEVTGMANHLAFPEYPESDLNVILLRFRSGVIGKVVVAFGAGRPQDHSVRIHGSEKAIDNNILFSKDGNYLVFARPHRSREDPPFYSAGTPRSQLVRRWVERSRVYWSARLLEFVMALTKRDEHYSVSSYPLRLYPHNLAVRASLENFVASVRGQDSLLCTLADSARTVVTCLAGVEAYRTGRTVKVSDYWLPEFEPMPIDRRDARSFPNAE